MKNKDFREIQVSSSLLVVIFLGVLALGVFIFLLGVNVGKKQVQIASRTQVVSEPIAEIVKEPAPAGAPEGTAAKTQAPPTTAPSAAKTAPAPGSGLYYVQVAAFTDRPPAAALADKYRKQGYTVVVTDPRPNESRTWYRVRLGGYASRERAVELLNKLNEAEKRKTDYRVVQD
jgi:cell division septation protein DedD